MQKIQSIFSVISCVRAFASSKIQAPKKWY